MPQLLQPHCQLEMKYSKEQQYQPPQGHDQQMGGTAADAAAAADADAAAAAVDGRSRLVNRESSRNSIFVHDAEQPITSVERCVSLDVSCQAFDDADRTKDTHSFHILLDGRTFGPYHRVLMRPLEGPNGAPLDLPVQCFSPLGR
jgi:hypothetical protein